MDSKATIPIPKLDDSNYEKWSTSMRLYLNAMKAWYLIEKRVLVSRAKDNDECALIYRASPGSMVVRKNATFAFRWVLRVGGQKCSRMLPQRWNGDSESGSA